MMPDDKHISDAERFLKYDYTETKDLCKQFLTLITTVLIISLTFSEKIIRFESASALAKWLVISSWISFLLAIILCGPGLLVVTMAAGEAVYTKQVNRSKAAKAYRMIIAAGGLFIIGLFLLISTVITATYTDNKDKTKETVNKYLPTSRRCSYDVPRSDTITTVKYVHLMNY